MSSKKYQTHPAVADISCSPVPCHSFKSKLSPNRPVVSPRCCSAIPCESLFVQGHSIGNTSRTQPDVTVSLKHPHGSGQFAMRNNRVMKFHRPLGNLRKGLAFRSYDHVNATKLMHSVRHDEAPACKSTLDGLRVTNRTNSTQSKYFESDVARPSLKAFSSKIKFKLSVTWSKSRVAADKVDGVVVEQLRAGSVEEKCSSTSQQETLFQVCIPCLD